ncbi:hypothetical protein BofuT4_uP147530.1 [Botrytis cinerea T4]|uniref:Uncharacterized protein n=1 Tax=Botryotinia fuckeliana (strain T4) TaxID=999810 RepID=G2YXH2_BOTF4|nr:hypothetical protein BofuT4_uP147530.1 [Botrytis cinerea T4]
MASAVVTHSSIKSDELFEYLFLTFWFTFYCSFELQDKYHLRYEVNPWRTGY